MECLAHVLELKFSQFNTVSPQHSLQDALYQMSCEHLDYLIVQDETHFIGLLSEQDIIHKVFLGNRPMAELQVKDIMNYAVPVADVQDSIDFAMQILDCYNSRYIAVFDNLEFKGIVSENDLLKKTLASKAKQASHKTLLESFDRAY